MDSTVVAAGVDRCVVGYGYVDFESVGTVPLTPESEFRAAAAAAAEPLVSSRQPRMT